VIFKIGKPACLLFFLPNSRETSFPLSCTLLYPSFPPIDHFTPSTLSRTPRSFSFYLPILRHVRAAESIICLPPPARPLGRRLLPSPTSPLSNTTLFPLSADEWSFRTSIGHSILPNPCYLGLAIVFPFTPYPV